MAFNQVLAYNRQECVSDRLMPDFVRMPVQRPKVVGSEVFSCFVDRCHIEKSDTKFMLQCMEDTVDMLELRMKKLCVVRDKQNDQRRVVGGNHRVDA